MNTWIYRALFAGAITLGLSGCFGETEANLIEKASAAKSSAPAQKSRPTVSKVVTLAVADGSVVVAAPSGFCVDEKASKDRRRGAFVLLAACGSITGSPEAGYPVEPALVTVAVGPEGSGDALGPMPSVKNFFTSVAGRAALSREGKAETVKVQRDFSANDTYFLQTQDNSPQRPDSIGERSWRAVFALGDRMVTVGVLDLAESGISADAGFALAETMVAQIRQASAPSQQPRLGE